MTATITTNPNLTCVTPVTPEVMDLGVLTLTLKIKIGGGGFQDNEVEFNLFQNGRIFLVFQSCVAPPTL